MFKPEDFYCENANRVVRNLAKSVERGVICIGFYDCSTSSIVRVWSATNDTPSQHFVMAAEKMLLETLATTFHLIQPTDSPSVSNSVNYKLPRGEKWLVSKNYLIGVNQCPGGMVAFSALISKNQDKQALQRKQNLIEIGLTFCEELLSERIEQNQTSKQISIQEAVLNHLSIGCIVVDRMQRVRFVNAAARDFLKSDENLYIFENQIMAKSPKDQKLLSEALSSAAVLDGNASIVQSDFLANKECTFIILPVFDGEPSALIIFGHDHGEADRILSDLFLQEIGLTNAERRLAHQLLRGETLSQAADNVNLTLSTARSYLKRIFAKTGIHRQSELISLYYSRIPPVRLSSQEDAGGFEGRNG